MKRVARIIGENGSRIEIKITFNSRQSCLLRDEVTDVVRVAADGIFRQMHKIPFTKYDATNCKVKM